MHFPVLKTKRLRLAHITKEHAGSLYEILSMDEVTRMYGMDSLAGIEEAIQIIESFDNSFLACRGIRWGMIHKATNQFIGTVGLNLLNMKSKRAEIGYELHPSYWGKGYTSEAVEEVLDYSFNELELYRMGAVTNPENDASIILLEKQGFTREGRLRGYLYQNEKSHDAFVFSLLKPEWKMAGKRFSS